MDFIKLGRIFDQIVKPDCNEMPDVITNLILDYADGDKLFVSQPTGICLLNANLNIKRDKKIPNNSNFVSSSTLEKNMPIYYCEYCSRVFKSAPHKHMLKKTHKAKKLLKISTNINKNKVQNYFKGFLINNFKLNYNHQNHTSFMYYYSIINCNVIFDKELFTNGEYYSEINLRRELWWR